LTSTFIRYIAVLYFQIIPFSANLRGCNLSSLNGSPSTVLYVPSLIGEERKLELTSSTFSYLPELKTYGLSFGYKHVAVSLSFVGDSSINEKIYSIGATRKKSIIDLGFSINLCEKQYCQFSKQELSLNIAVSKYSEGVLFGTGFQHSWNSKETSSMLFASFSEEWGVTYFDLMVSQGDRIFSVAQDLYLLPFVVLSFGMSQNPNTYFASISFRNYIKPSLSFRFLENLGYINSSGIEYTF